MVLLFTKRAVKKGESLLYNYNEAKECYPTDNFVWIYSNLLIIICNN